MKMKRTKLFVALGIAAAVAAAAALLLPSALAQANPSFDQDIYKITFASATSGAPAIPEWASLATGTWRAELEGQTFVSSDDSYVVIDNGTGSVYHRTGSPFFMGNLHSAPDGVLALRAYVKQDPTLRARGLQLQVAKDKRGKTVLNAVDQSGRQRFNVTIDEYISDQDAAAAHLLDTKPAEPAVTDVELGIGEAPSGMKAYWFGPATGTWHAAAAAEHSRVRTPAQVAAEMSPRGEVHAYIAFYERAGTPATSAQPGARKPRPAGELQVSSEPVDGAHAEGLLAAFDGRNGDETYAPWPRSNVSLADGEHAVVVPDQFEAAGDIRGGFYVLTQSTLISVSGDVALNDIPALAAKLRPIQ